MLMSAQPHRSPSHHILWMKEEGTSHASIEIGIEGEVGKQQYDSREFLGALFSNR